MNAIDANEEPQYIRAVAKYTKLTPFDKVKNQLMVKIKEIYLPDPGAIGGQLNKLAKLDFTGANDDTNYAARGGNDESKEQEKRPKKGALDFT